MDKSRFLLGATALLLSTSASAVLIQGTFSGTVSNNYTQAINQAFVYDVLVGQTVNGIFSFESDNVPPDIQPTASQAEYREDGSIDWLDITMSINGTVYDIDQYDNGLNQSNNWDRMYLTDGDLVGSNTDQFYIQETGYYNVTENNIRTFSSSNQYLNVFDSTDLLTFVTLDPSQTFSITDFTGYDGDDGYFYSRSFIRDNSTSQFTGGEGITYFGFDLTSLSLAVVDDNDPGGNGGNGGPTSVPEPSIIMLMGAGIIGLGIARRRRTQA